MYRIRYYDLVIHPDQLRSGWLGRMIIGMNFLRWKIEVFVQYLVLKFLLKRSDASKPEMEQIVESFKLDVQAEKLDCKQTSPLLPKVKTVSSVDSSYFIGGSVGGSLERACEDSGLPKRPLPLNQMAARYLGARAGRYSKGRHSTLIDEDHFEPVETNLE